MIHAHGLIEYLRGACAKGVYCPESLESLEKRIANAVRFDFGDVEKIAQKKAIEIEHTRAPFPLVLGQFILGGNVTIFVFEEGENTDGFVVMVKKPGANTWNVLPPTRATLRDGWACIPESQTSTEYENQQLSFYLLIRLAFATLACRNVRTVEVPAPAALNKKRARSGKVPLYSYKTLVVDVSEQEQRAESTGGTHASPRVHLRRGHIRRLPSGDVWVQPCVVGDKSLGMVAKDYEVRDCTKTAPMGSTC